MPTTPFRVKGQTGLRYVSDLFVEGTVESVDEGASFAWPDGPQLVGQPSTAKVLPFNGKGAQISDVTLNISVSSSVARDVNLSKPKGSKDWRCSQQSCKYSGRACRVPSWDEDRGHSSF